MFAGVKISEAFQGAGQELFNASVLGVAVVGVIWRGMGAKLPTKCITWALL